MLLSISQTADHSQCAGGSCIIHSDRSYPPQQQPMCPNVWQQIIKIITNLISGTNIFIIIKLTKLKIEALHSIKERCLYHGSGSCSLLSAKAGTQSQASQYGIAWSKWHCVTSFFSTNFSFSLSVSFQQCSTLIQSITNVVAY
jgi:hypothetical protein